MSVLTQIWARLFRILFRARGNSRTALSPTAAQFRKVLHAAQSRDCTERRKKLDEQRDGTKKKTPLPSGGRASSRADSRDERDIRDARDRGNGSRGRSPSQMQPSDLLNSPLPPPKKNGRMLGVKKTARKALALMFALAGIGASYTAPAASAGVSASPPPSKVTIWHLKHSSFSPPEAASDTRCEQLCGRVVKVADGDTLTLLDAANRQHKIRLQGGKHTDEQLAALHEMYYGPNGICRYSDSLEGWR